jgi:hypothetical protein
VEPHDDAASKLIRIAVEPILDDGPLYYKTIISDVEVDANGDLRSAIRDVFHTDSPRIAMEILRKVLCGRDKYA